MSNDIINEFNTGGLSKNQLLTMATILKEIAETENKKGYNIVFRKSTVVVYDEEYNEIDI